MHSLPLHLGKKLPRGKAAQFRGRGRRNQMKPVICSGIYIGNNTVPDILPTLSGTRKTIFMVFPGAFHGSGGRSCNTGKSII